MNQTTFVSHKRHHSSSRVKLKPFQTTTDNEGVPDGIEENLEEDKLSENSDTKEAIKIVTSNARKNFLCKNLFEQCRDLCYNQSMYKDFD